MRLKQYINELSMKANTNITSRGSQGNYEGFRIDIDDGEAYEVDIYKGSGVFSLANTDKYGKDSFMFLEKWDIYFSDAKTGAIEKLESEPQKPKTALKLFAAIEAIMKSFIKNKRPEAMSFSGLGKSKVKLYDMLAKKIIKGGYVGYSVNAKYRPAKDYEFIRKDLITKHTVENPKYKKIG